MLPGIGDINAKKLISYCGGPGDVFTKPAGSIRKIPGIGNILAESVIQHRDEALRKAEAEMEFIAKNKIAVFTYTDDAYPVRLKNCDDGPVVLYFTGNADLNNPYSVGIVGTRNATDYGQQVCAEFVAGIAQLDPLIVSGLALGIDGCAHREALKKGLQTVGVLGHGLDRIYPGIHQSLALKMKSCGGLVSDFPSGNKPDHKNFPKRNRVIAGLCDALIIIEAGKTGGALITGDIANSYNREVFAVPGRIGDTWSEGCNTFIRQNKAALIQSAGDFIEMMGWDVKVKNKIPVQREMFGELPPDENAIFSLILEAGEMAVDELYARSKMSIPKISSVLLSLEFKGFVKALPGKLYRPA